MVNLNAIRLVAGGLANGGLTLRILQNEPNFVQWTLGSGMTIDWPARSAAQECRRLFLNADVP